MVTVGRFDTFSYKVSPSISRIRQNEMGGDKTFFLLFDVSDALSESDHVFLSSDYAV